MPTDPYMTELVYPTEDSDEDIWDTILNTTVFPVLGAHDHTPGKGVKVPMAGLNVNADLAFAGYSITGMKALAFTPVAAASIAGYSSGLFANSDDANNLYFRNSSGVNVKIVDGSTLNVSIIGGIGGDYSSVSALLDYDDATDTYRFRQETATMVRQYAKIKSADLVLAEYIAAGGATVPTNFVTLKSPSALAASYSVTWPAAVPGSTVAVQMSSTGALTASNAFTGNLTADDYKINSGSIRRKVIPLGHGQQTGAGGHIFNTNSWSLTTTVLATLSFPIQLDVGDRILTVAVVLNKASNASNTVSVDCVKASGTGSGSSILDSAAALTNAANAPGTITLSQTLGTPYTFITRECVHITVVHDANPASATDSVDAVEITYDRP